MTERTRLISSLLDGLFSAGKKPEALSNIRLRERETKGAYTLAVRSKPEGTVKTVSLKMRQFLPLLRQDIGQI